MSLVCRPATIAAAFVAAHTCVDLAQAQVPEGHAVVATYTESGPGYVPGNPGLFMVPLTGAPVAPIPITGLPACLTTDGFGNYRQGSMSVSLRSSDGAVIVGTVGDGRSPCAGQVSLYVFHLTGTAVTSTQHIVLGTTAGLGYCFTAVAPDDRILVVASAGPFPLTTGPMAGSLTAIVDTSAPTPAFQLLPNPTGLPSPVALGGAAVDPSGEYAYAVLSAFPGSPQSQFFGANNAQLFRVHIATQTWCPIHSWPGESAFGIACDDDGRVYVSSTNPSTRQHFIHTVQPNACSTPTVTSQQSSRDLLAWGLALDRRGWFVAPSYHDRPGFAGTQLNAVSMISPSGTTTVVAQPPAAGWGTIGHQGQGIAVNNQVESYGASSPGQNSYWFENFPNPSGLPTVTGGNPSFSLTTKSAPGTPLLSAVILSLGRGSMTIAGVNLLINPATALTVILPGSQSSTIALPIPNFPSLAGFELFAQSLHLENGGGIAASRGLSLKL